MEWTKEIIPIKQLATGEQLSIIAHTLKGSQGPHIHIQASVHGAELQGNAVILQLMEHLQNTKLRGSITFIPLANPQATNNKHGTYTYGRYNPVTGHNWNRNYIDIITKTNTDLTQFCHENYDLPWHELKSKYKSLLQDLIENYVSSISKEKLLNDNNKLNLILQKQAVKADGILDLHTGPTATRYIYTAEYEEEVAKYMLFKNVLIIPNDFDGAMDEASFMPWIHLVNKMKELNREIRCDIEAFTLEFGSEETFCMDHASKDVESILNYLRYKGMLEETPKESTAFYAKLENYQTIYSPNGGLVDYRVKPGDHFNEGDILANIYQLKELNPLDPIGSSIIPVKALQNGIVINRCPSSAVHEGMELLQIMSHTYSK